jgi:hypothetical protein
VPKFRKKPVVVEAIQIGKESIHRAYEFASAGAPPEAQWVARACPEGLRVRTPEGERLGCHGDWLIRGVRGELYPCKPDIFAATYEPADGALTELARTHVAITKQLRQDLDGCLQRLKTANGGQPEGTMDPSVQRNSRERSLAVTKLQECIMWLGMDLKGLKEAGLSDEPSPYPSSHDPGSGVGEPTAQGLKL